MKKKVLFALISLFSCLTTWAADVVTITDGYTAELNTMVVALTDNGITPPAITWVKSGETAIAVSSSDDGDSFVFDSNRKRIAVEDVSAVGTYYLLRYATVESQKVALYVPFYVAAPATSNFDIVWNDDTWNAAKAEGHGLALYYADYEGKDPKQYLDYGYWHDAEDVKLENPGEGAMFTKMWDKANPTNDYGGKCERTWITAINSIDVAWPERTSNSSLTTLKSASTDADATAYAALSAEGGMPSANWKEYGYPWYVFYKGTNTNAFVPAFVYTEGDNTYYDIAKYSTGSLASFGGDGSAYMIMSGLFADAGYPLTLDVNNKTGVVNNAEAYAAKLANLQVLLVPADLQLEGIKADVQSLAGADVTCRELPYNGEEQYPTFSGLGVNSYVTLGTATLVENQDFVPVYPEGPDYTSQATYTFTIKGIGAYEGEKTNASYKISKRHVNINLAHMYKTYGDADPTDPTLFDFQVDASTPLVEGEDPKAAIAPYLVFKRNPDQSGEDAQSYEYFYDKAENFDTDCNYSVSFLQATSLLIIRPKNLNIYVTEATAKKEYNQADPAFKYVVDEALTNQLVDRDKNKTGFVSGTPSENDLITSITRPSAGTENGEDITPNGYELKATSYKDNYKVTVMNPFMITGRTDLSGIKIKFDACTYDGHEQTPGYKVYDGEKELTINTDYTVGENPWSNNIDACTKEEKKASLTIRMGGSYAEENVTDYFAIAKKALTVRPVTITSEPVNGTYEWEAVTMVEGETPTNQFEVNKFTDPSTISVKKIATPLAQNVWKLEMVVPEGGIQAKNYEITIGYGLLAMNGKTTIYVAPVAKSQVYGADPKELTISVANEPAPEPVEIATDAQKAACPMYLDGVDPLFEISREDATNDNVGTYDIYLDGPTVLNGYNVVYTKTLVDGYEITHRPLILQAKNVEKEYGFPVPTLEVNVIDGVTNQALTAEQVAAIPGLVNNGPNSTGYYVTLLRNEGWRYQNNTWTNNNEAVRNYTISAGMMSNSSSGNFGNYHVQGVQNGTLTVKKARIVVTADPQTKQFGEEDPEFTNVVTFKKDGSEVSATVKRAVQDLYEVVRGAETPVDRDPECRGEHPIDAKLKTTGTGANVAPAVNDYYVIENPATDLVDNTLTITAAKIQVIANDQWINYGGQFNEYDVIIIIPGKDDALAFEPLMATDDEKTIAAKNTHNAEIAKYGKLKLAEGVTNGSIGANKNAYVWVPSTDTNYELAEDKVVEGETVKGFQNGWLTVYPLEYIPLDLPTLATMTDVPLKQVLEDHKGRTVRVTLPAREMLADEWYAWVLPFPVDPATMFDNTIWGYGALEILDTEKSEGKNVVFALQVNEIPANTPFIAKITGKETYDKKGKTVKGIKATTMAAISIDGVVIDETFADYVNNKPAATATGVQFIGQYETTTGFTADQMYLASVDGGSRDFWPGGEKSKDVPFVATNACLQFGTTDLANVRIYIENEDGTFTAINGVEADAEVAYGEGWYTINGIKLEGEPTTTGTYIFNGKKVFIQK